MAVGLGIAIAVLIVELPRFGRERSLAGAVLTANADPRKQLPVPNVEITAEAGGTTARAKSDSSGFFRVNWRSGIWRGEQVTLRFRHPDYQPLEITQPLTDQLYIARMTSSASVKDLESHRQEISVADIRVRYAVKATTTINIGSTAKTFEVVNTGNVPCEPQATLFAGWQMEGRNWLPIARRRRRPGVSECESLLYCRALPVHEDRVGRVFPWRPQDRRLGSRLE